MPEPDARGDGIFDAAIKRHDPCHLIPEILRGSESVAEKDAPRHRARRWPDSCPRRHSRWLICERCAGSYGWTGLSGRHRATSVLPPAGKAEADA